MASLDNYFDRLIVDQFLDKYKNIKSKERYQTTISDFINLIDYKNIADIRKDEILDHFELIKDNAARVCHMKEFLKFLVSNSLLNANIINDGRFIDQIYKMRAIQKDTGRTAIKYPINVIVQIDYDIKNNYKNPQKENAWDYERKMKIALFWELIFDAGCKVTDLKSLKARYLLDKREYLKSEKMNPIAEKYHDQKSNIIKEIINDYYHTLLMDLDKKKNKDGFSSLLSLGEYNNDELQIYGLLAEDIIAARNKFYIHCPSCGTEVKITSDNWVFVKHKDNNDKYLACINCKGNDIHG